MGLFNGESGGGVPVYCIPCVYFICNVHLCMHSYSCLHVGFRMISYLESSSQLSSKGTIQREASRYMPAAISAYKEALRKTVI